MPFPLGPKWCPSVPMSPQGEGIVPTKLGQATRLGDDLFNGPVGFPNGFGHWCFFLSLLIYITLSSANQPYRAPGCLNRVPARIQSADLFCEKRACRRLCLGLLMAGSDAAWCCCHAWSLAKKVPLCMLAAGPEPLLTMIKPDSCWSRTIIVMVTGHRWNRNKC